MTTRVTIHVASHPVKVTLTEAVAGENRTHIHLLKPSQSLGSGEHHFHIHSDHTLLVEEFKDKIPE